MIGDQSSKLENYRLDDPGFLLGEKLRSRRRLVQGKEAKDRKYCCAEGDWEYLGFLARVVPPEERKYGLMGC